MDDQRFDEFTRAFGTALHSRRGALRVLVGAVAGAFLPAAGLATACGKESEPCVCCRPGLTCTNGSCCPDDRVCTNGCCPPGYSCQDGTCVRSRNGRGNPGGCPAGQAPCGAVGCVDVTSDLANCGACGNTCPTSTDPCLVAVCQAGSCGFAPGPDGIPCDDGNACTQTDTCQGGVCVGGNPVVCEPLDQCHVAGACDSATGTCSNPNASDGTSCKDDNACTTGDTCQSGVCAGGTLLTCTSDNPCLSASCDPNSGCVTTPKPKGTSCDDSDLCNGNETCDGAGSCVAETPVKCSPCLTCDASTGTCSPDASQDGQACPGNGDKCFGGFVCQSGSCVGTDPVTCAASDQCHIAGTCDPGTGLCSNPDAPDNTSCSDGDACTAGDVCQSGVCTGTPVQPSFDCPANIVQSVDAGVCEATVSYDVPVTACASSPVASCEPASGSQFAVGAHDVTCTASNAAGQHSCTFSVTVTDDEAPSITCPGPQTAQAPAGGTVNVDYAAPTVSNNCAGPGVSYQCTPPSGSAFGIGTTTVSCTASDATANQVNCSFDVTVTATCQPTCAGTCGGASDGCGGICPNPCRYDQSCCGGQCYSSFVIPCDGQCVACPGSPESGCGICVPASGGLPPKCYCA